MTRDERMKAIRREHDIGISSSRAEYCATVKPRFPQKQPNYTCCAAAPNARKRKGMTRKLSPHEEREIACSAECDPKTVRRALADPDAVRPLSLQRIERALHERGLDHLLPRLDCDDE